MPEKKIDGGSCAVERISGAGCYQSSIALSQSLLARSTMGRPAFRLATNLGLFPIWEDGVKRGIVADRLKGFTFRFPFVYQALHFIQEHLLIRFAPRLRVGVRRPRFVMNQATDVEVELFRHGPRDAVEVRPDRASRLAQGVGHPARPSRALSGHRPAMTSGPSSLSDSGFDFRVYADDGVTHR